MTVRGVVNVEEEGVAEPGSVSEWDAVGGRRTGRSLSTADLERGWPVELRSAMDYAMRQAAAAGKGIRSDTGEDESPVRK